MPSAPRSFGSKAEPEWRCAVRCGVMRSPARIPQYIPRPSGHAHLRGWRTRSCSSRYRTREHCGCQGSQRKQTVQSTLAFGASMCLVALGGLVARRRQASHGRSEFARPRPKLSSMHRMCCPAAPCRTPQTLIACTIRVTRNPAPTPVPPAHKCAPACPRPPFRQRARLCERAHTCAPPGCSARTGGCGRTPSPCAMADPKQCVAPPAPHQGST